MRMKKLLFIAMATLILMSSCGSYTASGAYVGAQFGHVLGSSIGGISGGWRGHDTGAPIGTMGGAVVGAAIGAAAENAQARKAEQAVQARRGINDRYQDNSGFDAMERGDDRITFDDAPTVAADRSFSVDELSRRTPIEIRHAKVTDKSGDGVLVRGEECTVSFEIMNNTNHTVYDIYPWVEDATGNKHVAISPNLRVESIAPHQGVRYTATILADKRLKDGQIVVRIGVAKGEQDITSQSRQFTIPTKKKIG